VVDIADPLTTTALGGTFTFDNDVALFNFLLGPGTFTFTAGSTSAATGFDPILALFGPDGNPVTYTDEFGGIFPALAFGDIDGDFQFPVITLAGGVTYTLAVTQYGPVDGNFPHDTLAEGFDKDDDSLRCFTFIDSVEPSVVPDGCTAGAAGMFGGQSGTFSLDFTVALEGGGGGETPVPEPGTLSLVALGAAAAALKRRRRAHHTTT
jgi:hypothetical protein